MNSLNLQPCAEASTTAEDWLQRRSPQRPADLTLSALALRWSADLPPILRPHQLERRFPRIANRLALCWCDAKLADAVLRTLLFDNRNGQRAGFGKAIADELWSLRHEVLQRIDAANAADLWAQHTDATWVRSAAAHSLSGLVVRKPMRMYGKLGTGY